jgi:hypothetical protein
VDERASGKRRTRVLLSLPNTEFCLWLTRALCVEFHEVKEDDISSERRRPCHAEHERRYATACAAFFLSFTELINAGFEGMLSPLERGGAPHESRRAQPCSSSASCQF